MGNSDWLPRGLDATGQRRELIARLETAFLPGDAAATSKKKLARALGRYSDELLGMLDDRLAGNSPGVWMIRDSIEENSSEETLREHVAFFPYFHHLNHTIAKDMVRSLHRYRQLPLSLDLSSEGDEVLFRCVALLVVMEGATRLELDLVFRNEDPPFVLKDDRLVELVLAHSGDAGRIAGFIRDRETADPDLIEAMLTTEAPALGDGLL